MILTTKTQTKKITMKQLFNNYNIPDKQHEICMPLNTIKVSTPYGFKDIVSMFRTQKQQSCRLYCTNNKTIQIGASHRFKINGS